ncbi:hypothetical protein [Desulfotruncus alcoholivorax]|uniref:hypothetical protein n=1 Tax=Desulfotruncus alcoholivorax TaxID=265477 RepID=UPI0004016F87|nr:hypothetical protein [Desulfotruncus alcoholivorax]
MHKKEDLNYDGFIREMIRETSSYSPLKTTFFAFVTKLKSALEKSNTKKAGVSGRGKKDV